jgi:PAS domain S-box-containing protein
MRTFIERAMRKLPKLTVDQITALLLSATAENERLESVLDSLADGLLVCDPDNNLILVNKAAERLLPLSLHDQGEKPVWMALADETIADFLLATLLSGDRITEREFAVAVKGVERVLAISVLPMVREKRVTGSLVLAADVTEKRGKEARLRRAENLASLTTLAAGVAHEIKNPLGSISIHIQLIQKALKSSRAACSDEAAPRSLAGAPFELLDKYLGVVNEEIDRLNRIVVDFLFAVRPMDIELRAGDLNHVVRDLVEFTHFELNASGIDIVLELADSLPEVDFDERYIKQALLNLVKNAQAAMPTGGRLTIGTAATGDALALTVADTGVGIPEDNLPKIFEPYFSTKESGSGLGLTLVFKIIKEHRGEISVQSKEGEGTVFRIVLPVPQKETRLLSFEGNPS